MPLISLEDAEKAGRQAALIWIQEQTDEVPSKAVIEAFDESCAKFQKAREDEEDILALFFRKQ